MTPATTADHIPPRIRPVSFAPALIAPDPSRRDEDQGRQAKVFLKKREARHADEPFTPADHAADRRSPPVADAASDHRRSHTPQNQTCIIRTGADRAGPIAKG